MNLIWKMDQEQATNYFRSLARNQPDNESISSLGSEADSCDSDVTLPPPEASNQPPSGPVHDNSVPSSDPVSADHPSSAETASSDAETIEPEHYQPPPLESVPSPVTRPSTQQQPSSPHSTNSSAGTIPPPSPAALNRYYAAAHQPAAEVSRPVVVQIDEGGIDGWEDDRVRQRERQEQRRGQLGEGYPVESGFLPKFIDKNPDELTDIQLSNRSVPLHSSTTTSSFGILPACILKYLGPYQRDGVTFLYRLYERERGGLLADAMGLGKTVQAVCFLGAAFAIWDRDLLNRNLPDPEPAPRILVVSPASVRENWKREFERWTPFRVKLYDKSSEAVISRALRTGDVDVIIAGDNPVGSYGKSFFSYPYGEEWKWDVVIVDEIHSAKNANTKLYRSLQALPRRAMFGLTGTAIQNRLRELWNVMSLVVPSSLWLSSKSFKADYTDIIVRGSKKDASYYMRQRSAKCIDRLRKLLSKHMVRRPKITIQEQLPGKSDYVVLMRMKRDGLQGYMYQRFQNSYDVKLLRDACDPCDCGSQVVSKECCHRFPTTPEDLANAPIWRSHHKDLEACKRCPNCICFALQYYSQSIAAHALLLRPEDSQLDPEKAETRANVLRYYLGKYKAKASQAVVIAEQEANLSCKLNVALRLLSAYKKQGHKTIIFYESLRLGGILQRWAIGKGFRFEIIEGRVAKEQRQGVIDRFNTDTSISVIFISKKAGGTGLNISAANRVLIFEPCWNPTLDLQAGDRAHRLGQKRVVHIIRLVVENTIEHYVFKTALSKSQLSSAILDNTKEEWRVAEKEVGSMRAMLRMGDVFAEDDNPDNFQMLDADELNEGGQTAKPDGQTKAEANREPSSEEPDSLRDEVSEEVGALGDFEMCSLDVDIETGEFSDDEGDGDRNIKSSAIMEASQMESDILFGEGGASKKLVMDCTIAGKRRTQVMGINVTKDKSGINADGPANINFDETAHVDLGLSQDEPQPVRRRRVSRGRIVIEEDDSSEPEESKAARPEPKKRRKATQPKKPAARSAAANTSKPKQTKLSVFATRAKVRR